MVAGKTYPRLGMENREASRVVSEKTTERVRKKFDNARVVDCARYCVHPANGQEAFYFDVSFIWNKVYIYFILNKMDPNRQLS